MENEGLQPYEPHGVKKADDVDDDDGDEMNDGLFNGSQFYAC